MKKEYKMPGKDGFPAGCILFLMQFLMGKAEYECMNEYR